MIRQQVLGPHARWSMASGRRPGRAQSGIRTLSATAGAGFGTKHRRIRRIVVSFLDTAGMAVSRQRSQGCSRSGRVCIFTHSGRFELRCLASGVPARRRGSMKSPRREFREVDA